MKTGVALALAVALVAGGAVGYLIGSSKVPETAPDAGRAGGRAADPDPERPRPPEPPPPEPETGLAAEIDRIPSPGVGTGDGRFYGHVALEDGRPLAGATVEAIPLYGDERDDAETLEEEVVKFVRRRRFEREGTRTAVTDESGAWTIDGVADRMYRVWARRDGYAVFHAAPGRFRPDAEINFSARRQLTLTVEVLGPEGEPVEDASVAFGQGGVSGRWPWTPANPDLTLQPGTWEIHAIAGRGGELVSGTVTVEAGEDERVTLRLKPRPGIRGRVTFEDGLATGSVQVAILSAPPGSDIEPEALGRSPQRTWLSGHDGFTFSFPDLAPGDWLVGVIADDRVVAHEVVTVGDRMVDADLVVPAPDREDYVIVRVVGPDGAPLDAVRFSVGYDSSSSSSSGGVNQVRLPDGTWRVPHRRLEESRLRPDGVFYVEATHPRYGSRRVEYVPGEDETVEIGFEEPAEVSVTVTGLVGTRWVGQVQVGLAPPARRRGRSPTKSASPDAEGVAEFDPVVPGPWELRLRLTTDGRFGGQIALLSREVVVGSGVNRFTVAMPPLYDLIVRTTERVGLTLDDGDISIFPREPEDGRVVFRGLPAGTWLLRGSSMDGTMKVRLPGPAEVEFAPLEPNAFEVKIRDPQGALGRAGLRDGDLVVGVNGEEFEGGRKMRAKLMLAMSEEGPARLLVLRGGSRIEVEIDLSALREEPDGGGGRLEPVTR